MSSRSKKSSRIARYSGLAVAGIGLSHFSSPQMFESITKPAFPENTTRWTYTNGASETLIGLAIANKRTRRFGYIGLVGYLGFLASRVI